MKPYRGSAPISLANEMNKKRWVGEIDKYISTFETVPVKQ